MPTVSVIIPVFNVEEYVDRCISSVTRQSFTDIEIIIINDGSTDDSGGKCLEWLKHDNRIIYVCKKNEGAGPARNLGIQMASSEYVAFCDPDDWYDIHFLEMMLAKQKETSADIVICGWHDYDGDLGKVVNSVIPEAYQGQGIHWKWNIRHAVWLKLFRRDIFIKNNIKMPSCIAQDTAIHFFMMAIIEKIAVVELPLYFYLFNRMGSAKNDCFRHTADFFEYVPHGLNLFIDAGLFEKYRINLFVDCLDIINGWYYKIASDIEYAKRWKDKGIGLLHDYFGDTAKLFNSRICLVGSYSLYKSLYPKIYAVDNIGHSFSGLISYMSEKEMIPPDIDNDYRQISLNHDFQKTLIKKIETDHFDFLIIDFLDERFDVITVDGGYYTMSDPFLEADMPFEYQAIHKFDKETIDLWKKSCLLFIEVLKKHFSAERVVLVKNLLAEKYGKYGKLKYYDNIDEIREVNSLLSDYYAYFESNYADIKSVSFCDPNDLYTDEDFKHGCMPWHYNDNYYNKAREIIYDCLNKHI